MYVVFQTEDFKQQVQKHGFKDKVTKLINSIEKNQRFSPVSFGRLGNYRKKRLGDYRLIIKEKEITINDQTYNVLVFFKFINRGDKNTYDAINDQIRKGQTIHTFDDEDIKKYLIDRFKNNSITKQKLNEEEKDFLWNISAQQRNLGEDYIYETKNWINNVKKFREFLNNIREKIENILYENEGKTNIDNKLKEENINRIKIYYRYYSNKKILLLCDIRDDENTVDLNDCIKFEDNNIARIAFRGYPSFFVIDDNIWFDIQNDNGINLVLSPEEKNILSSLYNQETAFPLFINGRAGSGKSTILQFIFADYLKIFNNLKSDNFSEPPVLLSYSEDLVSNARERVNGLLTKHHKYIIDDKENIDSGKEQEIKELVYHSIKTYKEFLLNFLDKDDKQKFDNGSYVDFSKFYQLWHEKYGKTKSKERKIGPEIAWHIIRTYIKGFYIEDYLSPEEYETLPDSEKSVSIDDYKTIYNSVWGKWYKGITVRVDRDDENSYWDDLDLARYILKNNRYKSIYPGIFCDEAQDFTRVELELLFNLNLYTQRELNAESIKRVPIIFAGDPFQTLNPTGFRWESLKKAYNDIFVESIPRNLRYDLDQVNYKELKFNYRSAPEIVKLSNSIQLLRRILLEIKIEPQDAWFNQNQNNFPTFLTLSDNKDKDNILEALKNKDIIVPCNLGEEYHYVKNDKYLKDLIDTSEEIPTGILSPMKSKGMEWDFIVLYGFAEKVLDEIKKVSKLTESDDFNDLIIKNLNKRILNEYFINKLYVAVTRAQNKIFIIEESNETYKDLWGFLDNEIIIDKIERGDERDMWKNKLGRIIPGKLEDFYAAKIDPRKRAENYREIGEREKDPYLLRQAAKIYTLINDLRNSNICKARAFEFEGKYKKAAEIYYNDLRDFDRALENFWKASEFIRINELFYKKNNILKDNERVKLSHFITVLNNTKSITDSFISDLEVFIFNNDYNSTIVNPWTRKAYDELINGLRKICSSNFQERPEICEKIYSVYQKLMHEGIYKDYKILAELAYYAKNYKRVMEIYEELGLTNEPLYLAAKHLYYLYLKKIGEINENQLEWLAEDYLGQYGRKCDIDKAWKIFENNLNLPFIEIVNKLKNFHSSSDECNNEITEFIIKKLNQEFESIINNTNDNEEVFQTLVYILSLLFEKYRVSLKIAEKKQFINFLVKSKTLERLDQNTQSKISDIIEELFIKNKNWKRRSYDIKKIACIIEKSGRYISALKFYEDVMDEKKHDEDLFLWAQQRWLKNKNKQLSYELDSKRKESIQKEINRKANLWKLNLDEINDLPEYPCEDKKPKPTALPEIGDDIIIMKYDFSIENYVFSVRQGRIRQGRPIFIEFKNNDTLEAIKIYLDNNTLSLKSDDGINLIRIEENKFELPNEFVITINNENLSVEISLLKYKLELRFFAKT